LFNRITARAIAHEIALTAFVGIAYDQQKYNGIDLAKLSNQGSIAAYLTKYVSKNQQVYNFQPWHCSRGISSFRVGKWIGKFDIQSLFQQRMLGMNYLQVKDDNEIEIGRYYFWMNGPPSFLFSELISFNKHILTLV
jgi:hypothetical protein